MPHLQLKFQGQEKSSGLVSPDQEAHIPLQHFHLCPSTPASLIFLFSLCIKEFLSSRNLRPSFPLTLISFLQSSFACSERPVSAAPLRARRASSLFHNMVDTYINTRLKINLFLGTLRTTSQNISPHLQSENVPFSAPNLPKLFV